MLANAVATLATSNGALLPSMIGKDPSPPDALALAERAELVRDALTTLPVDYGMLLTARYLDGETVAAIARRERTNEVAVRSKLARARQAFREAFSKYDSTHVHSKENKHESS